ncbi:MAG: nucleotidyltransferase domain-containing protein [Candidatus Latescibacterota bacterium]
MEPSSAVPAQRCLQAAIAVAQTFCRARFPAHTVALLGGSWACGCARPGSDLDLLVIDPTVPGLRFEGVEFEGWLVEVCALPPERLEGFFRACADHRSAPVPQQAVESVVLRGDAQAVLAIRQLAGQVLRAGPAPLTQAEAQDLRWNLTALLTDLEHAAPDDLAGVAAQCYARLAEAILASARAWRAERRRLPQALRQAAPDLAQRLETGLLAACQGDRTLLVGVGQEILQRIGGPQRLYAEEYP